MRLILLALLLYTGVANAAPVTWTFENVRFADGGELSGSFVFYADTFTTSDIDLFATSGGGFASSPYDICGGPACEELYTPWPGEQMLRFDNSSNDQLRFAAVFMGLLTNDGGTINLRTGNCFASCGLYGLGDGTAEFRATVSGFVTGVPTVVPIPAAVWLFASALGGLGWLRTKLSP